MAKSTGQGGGQLPPFVETFGKKFAEGVDRIGTSFTAATGALEGMKGAIGGVISASAKYVEAVSPSSVLVLNQAMYDLQAVIGTALTPIIEGAAQAIKMIGSVLFPLMRNLQPVVAKLTGTLLDLLEQALPAFDALGEAVVMLAEGAGWLVEVLAPLITVVTAISTVFMDLFKALVQWIAGLLGGDVAGGFKEAIQTFAKYLILAIATIARVIGDLFGVKGGGMVVQSLIDATKGKTDQKREDVTGAGVARNAATMDFASYGRKIAEAALIAGAGAEPERTQQEWLKDLHEQLKLTKEGGANKMDELLLKLNAWFLALPGAIARAIRDLPGKAWSAAQQKSVDAQWWMADLQQDLLDDLGLSGVSDYLSGK